MIELLGTALLWGFVGVGIGSVTIAACLWFEYRILRPRALRRGRRQ